jgi:hypothetical protein
VDYDDIVIGSGLCALGVVLGLARGNRTLVLAGPAQGTFAHYDASRSVPCAYLGTGGLGNFWHGVIPLSRAESFSHRFSSMAEFRDLFAHFYPGAPPIAVAARPHLFVPWRPIRPKRELLRLTRRRGGALVLRAQHASRFDYNGAGLAVYTLEGPSYSARRLWIAAGCLHTPALLERSLGQGFARDYVSDHALYYLGLLRDHPAPAVARSRDGVFFPAYHDTAATTLYTLRPARFAFRELDAGIEQRAVFGLPTGSAVAKIMRRMSPALLAEALFNRTGLFARAASYSVYAQTRVADAYALGTGALPLQVRLERITAAAVEARARAPFAGLQHSKRSDLYIPGIHLHHSVEPSALSSHGINQPGSPVQIVDSSVVADVGPEHPSFRLMLLAYIRARKVCRHFRN